MSEWGVLHRGRILAGVFLLIFGVLWLLNMLGLIKFNVCIIGPILVIIAGIALLIRRDFWDWW